MKKFILLIATILLLSSCAETKHYNTDTGIITADPYGWIDYLDGEKKVPGVEYKVHVGNLIIDAISIETIFVPALLSGYQFYEPTVYVDSVGNVIIAEEDK